MGKSCIICNNKFKKGSPISFHKFPKSLSLKKLWCEAIGMHINNVLAFDVICSVHFSPTEIKSSPSGRKKYLVETAVPSVPSSSQNNICQNDTLPESFDNNKENTLPPEELITERLTLSIETPQISDDENLSANTSPLKFETFVTDSSSESSPISVKSFTSVKTSSTVTASEEEIDMMMEEELDTIRKKSLDYHSTKTSIEVLKDTISKQKQIICKLKRQNRRLKSRVECQKSVWKYLRDNNLIGKTVEAIIEATLPGDM